jgi:hypothetical protein
MYSLGSICSVTIEKRAVINHDFQQYFSYVRVVIFSRQISRYGIGRVVASGSILLVEETHRLT